MNQTPNVTPADVEACIAVEHYFTAADGYRGASGLDPCGAVGGGALSLLTFCVLVTHNGHTVVGEAHCQDPAKFSTAIGREAARADAIRQLWPMVVYAARDRLKPADLGAKVASIARKFIDDNRVSCEEACAEDRVYENAPNLVGDLAEVVGYYQYPDVDPESATDTQDAS